MTTVLAVEVEVDREDLARNGLPAPEEWTFDDLVRADAIGLIYGYSIGTPREVCICDPDADGTSARGCPVHWPVAPLGEEAE